MSPDQASLRKRLPDLLTDPGLSALVVRGAQGSGRTTLLGAAAATLALDVLVYEGELTGPSWPVFEALALLAPVLPVVRVAPGPGETLRLPPFGVPGRPLGVVCGRSGGLAGPPLEHGLTLNAASVGREERRRLWATGGVDDLAPELDEIVERFLLTPGNIRRAAPVARLQAQAAGRSLVMAEDVRAASRTLRRQELETLATLLEPLPASARPVFSPAAESEFETLLLRCRHRERLTESAAQPGLNRGVRALFSGASGTGKTLAARHLAAVLDLDLYRIDLAAVVNKYIGETERNLDRVLARAEELDIVLLLDEGDALMTRRTDVSTANDRYANLETNFLLQRLETFDGIVVVTSNAAGRIDPAFLRRIDVTVDFVPPDAAQRRRIWDAHLPPGPPGARRVARRPSAPVRAHRRPDPQRRHPCLAARHRPGPSGRSGGDSRRRTPRVPALRGHIAPPRRVATLPSGTGVKGPVSWEGNDLRSPAQSQTLIRCRQPQAPLTRWGLRPRTGPRLLTRPGNRSTPPRRTASPPPNGISGTRTRPFWRQSHLSGAATPGWSSSGRRARSPHSGQGEPARANH